MVRALFRGFLGSCCLLEIPFVVVRVVDFWHVNCDILIDKCNLPQAKH